MRTNLKKALAVLMTLVMLCGLLPMGMLSVSAADANLDLNFDDGTGAFSGASIVAEGPDGSNCMKFTATGGWSACYTYAKNMDPANDYTITLKAKGSVAGGMGITIQNGDWGSFWNGPTFAVTTSWQDYTIEVAANQYPFTAGTILFKFQDVGTAMDLYIDDLVLTQKVEEIPETPTTGENLIVNGSFEESSGGWTYGTYGSRVSGGYEGSYSLQMQDPATAYANNAIQYVTVEPSTNYTLTWWAKRTAGTGIFNIYLDDWMNETSGNWVQYTINLTTAATCTKLLVKFSNESASTSGTILIDDVWLTKDPVASFDGYLTNGDFEIGDLTGWSVAQTATVTAEAAYSGSYGAHITNPAGNYGGMIYQGTVNVVAGKTYTVSFWIKVVTGYVNFQIKDSTISNTTNLVSKGTNSTSWTQLSFTVTPTTNVFYLNFCGGGTGTVDEAYVDDFSIVEEKEASDDGYIKNGDFETGKVTPWTVYSSTAISADAKYEGDYGLSLVGDGGWGGLAYQQISNLKTGKEYTVTLWVKVVAGGVNVQIKGSNLSGDSLTAKYYATNNAGSWTQLTMTWTADANYGYINFCGDGTGTAATAYVDSIVVSRVGGEVAPEELMKFDGNSIKENSDGIGLAFKFNVTASHGEKNFSNEYVEESGAIVLDEVEYTLVRMGAVITNQESVGTDSDNFTLDNLQGGSGSSSDAPGTVIDVSAKYLCYANSETLSYAVRILNIPEAHHTTRIYARPYFVYLVDGEEVTVYGDIKYNTYYKLANPDVVDKSSIKILSIGHSFSKDVMVTNLYNMFKEGGYDEVVIGYLYMAGCSMPKHLYNIQNSLAQYQYGKNSTGSWVTTSNVSALTALKDEDWDFVTVQSSPDYIGGQTISSITLGVNSEGDKIEGINQTEYEAMDEITDWILANATNADVKIDYHMIWAFSEGCNLWSYTYHNYDQMTMYNNIIEMTKQEVVNHSDINSIIPCATSIQNARTSFMGDNFNMPDATQGGSDGYHLNDYGDYVAALTWYCHYSKDNADVMAGYTGVLSSDQFEAVAEAVNNAISDWDSVTQSTYTE